MKKLKIGVVEDELVIGRTILMALEELGYDFCGPSISYTEALEMIENERPDLLLLDIQLAGRKDGIDIAEQINEKFRLPFIFLTANSDGETIERAKKVVPHAYIVKPFSKEELHASVEIAFSNFNSRSKIEKEAGIHNADAEFIFVKDGYAFRKIYHKDLLCVESDANYVSLHLKSQKKIMVRSTLVDFIDQLNSRHFVRVHRSYFVNVQLIEDVFPTELSIQGMKVPLGKSYKDSLFKILGINAV